MRNSTQQQPFWRTDPSLTAANKIGPQETNTPLRVVLLTPAA
ncbi:MAG: hypothetical protein R3C28_13525 [Pirellulaceae bacterium]